MSYRAVSVYSKDTGLFVGRTLTGTSLSDELLAMNLGDSEAHIEGHHDHLSRKVDLATGEVVDHQPPTPSTDHEWNDATKRWQLQAAAQAKHDDRQSALAQIAAIEARQPRAIREAILGYDGAAARLRDIDDQVIALRSKL